MEGTGRGDQNATRRQQFEPQGVQSAVGMDAIFEIFLPFDKSRRVEDNDIESAAFLSEAFHYFKGMV